MWKFSGLSWIPGVLAGIFMFVADSDTRRFTLIGGSGTKTKPAGPVDGLADVVTLQRLAAMGSSQEDERALFQDTAEYCWARDVVGLAFRDAVNGAARFVGGVLPAVLGGADDVVSDLSSEVSCTFARVRVNVHVYRVADGGFVIGVDAEAGLHPGT
ncbi:hypothetical protein ABZY57_04130 [Streptomyces sp. NPDC006450]|uniref:hypothetical protein n=1 Tax=Streptomyces sp. NPDC006450 TaxID=3155458 RepID=UPI0033BD4EEC